MSGWWKTIFIQPFQFMLDGINLFTSSSNYMEIVLALGCRGSALMVTKDVHLRFDFGRQDPLSLCEHRDTRMSPP